MKRSILLAAVMAGLCIGNCAYGADVSDWSGLSGEDGEFTLINDITAAGGKDGTITKSDITQTIDGNNHTITGLSSNSYEYLVVSGNDTNITLKNAIVTEFKSQYPFLRVSTTTTSPVVNVINTTFTNNSSTTGGGGIYFSSSGTLNLDTVTFSDNSTTKYGGALWFGSGILNMDNVIFNNNTSSQYGGAIYISDNAEINMKDVAFDENCTTGTKDGGAVYMGNNNTADFDNVSFTNNHSKYYGGAIYMQNSNTVSISNSVFSGNYTENSSKDGGAIWASNGSLLTIDNTTFTENHTNLDSYAAGGAINMNTLTSLKLTNSEFSGNFANEGGAINTSGSLEIYNTIFSGNYSNRETAGKNAFGGAVYSGYYSGINSIISSAFTENSSDYGGAIYLSGVDANIVDTDFTDNTAKEGAAIYSESADLNIFADTKDVIFSGNIASNDDFDDIENSYNGGGAIYVDNSTLSLNASDGRTIVFDDTVAAYGTSVININNTSLTYTDVDGNEVSMGNTGEIQFNNYVGDSDGNIFDINLYGGTLSIGQNSENNSSVDNPDGWMNYNNFYIKGDGSILNTVNNVVGSIVPNTFEIDSVNWQYNFDVDLASETADYLTNVTNNSGSVTLNLEDLNIMNDTSEDEVKIYYSDASVDGSLSGGNTITTSAATYEVTAGNEDSGSYLIFTKESQSGGLAYAIKTEADVYSITNGEDEIVTKWELDNEGNDKNNITNDLIINANGNSITTENGIIGIFVSEDYKLTINDAKDFSGFENALTVDYNAELNINNSNITGNTGDNVIRNSFGTVNINASSSDVLIAQGEAATAAIESLGGTINISGNKTVTIDGDIIGDEEAEMNISTDTVITGMVKKMVTSQNTGDVTIGAVQGGSYTLNDGTLTVTDSLSSDSFTIAGGTLDLTNGESIFNASSTILNGGTIDLVNDSYGNLNLGSVTLNGTTNLSVDANLSSEIMDTISASNITYNGGSINVSSINLTGQTNNSSVTIPFADSVLKNYVTTDVKSVTGEIFKYTVGYDKNTGNFTFTGGGNSAGGYNPAVFTGAVATQIGGYLTQAETLQQGFYHMNRYTKYTSGQRLAAEYNNRYAITEGGKYSQSPLPETSKGTWFNPYSSFETVNLKGGIGVSNVTYGALAGGDTDLYELGNGYKGVISAFAGYNGSHQSFNHNSMYQNGGVLGVTGTLYKNNFFTGITASAGASSGEAGTMYGTDNFTMLTAGIASRTGYNIEYAEGRFIVQPSLYLGYTFVNTFDYKNAAGVNIDSDPLHALQIIPGVTFIGNLKNGLQPYAAVNMVWNAMDKTHFTANDITLPQLSVKPYVQYGIGLQKTWGEKFTGFMQAMLRNGGRNGIALQAGFRWAIGKDAVQKVDAKKTVIKVSKAK